MNALIKDLLPIRKGDLDKRTRWKGLDDANLEHPQARLLGDLYKGKNRVRQLLNYVPGLCSRPAGACAEPTKLGRLS